MKRNLVLMLALGHVVACSPFKQVYDVGDLEQGEKVVVGEVRIVNGDLAQWVEGIYTGAYLAFDYKDVNNGQVEFHMLDGANVRDLSFYKNGALFSVGVRNQDVLVMSIRATSTLIIASGTATFPLLVWIKPSPNRCEYIGTLLVSRKGKVISTDVKDEYDRFRRVRSSLVSGCALAKNLGTPLH